jgi:multiple sugar transport system permease protein
MSEGNRESGSFRANRAGWLMAFPAVFLLVMFLIVPFLLAFGLSFTNQRLLSPNPTEFVGLRNFEQLLGVGTLTLSPLPDAAADGGLKYPPLRDYTRNNPD